MSHMFISRRFLMKGKIKILIKGNVNNLRIEIMSICAICKSSYVRNNDSGNVFCLKIAKNYCISKVKI